MAIGIAIAIGVLIGGAIAYAAYTSRPEQQSSEMAPQSLESIQVTTVSEGQVVQVQYFEGRPISVDLPITMIFEVTYTEPGYKGNTVSNVYKDATLENNTNIKVPSFIKVGNKLDKSKPVIVYCKSGNDSVKCIEKMEEAGFVKTYDVDKGIAKWKFIGSDIRSNP